MYICIRSFCYGFEGLFCEFSCNPIALFTVSFSHLHYNVIQRVCEAISGYFVVLAGNCLAHTLNYIVMQMKKLTVKGAIKIHLVNRAIIAFLIVD